MRSILCQPCYACRLVSRFARALALGIRSTRPEILLALVVMTALSVCTAPASAAQERRYAYAARGAPMDEALRQFVELTGAAVSYDPAVVRGRRAFCRTDGSTPDELLRCILKDSGLDFLRRSSGTFVIQRSIETAPLPGFVAGLVTDGETGSPLSGAHVHVAGALATTFTNESGQFVLPPLLPGRYALSVSHLGYRTWQDSLSVHSNERRNEAVSMVAEPILVSPLVVNGARVRNTDAGVDFHTGRSDFNSLEHRTPPGLAASARRFSMLGALQGVRIHDVTADVFVQDGEAGMHQYRLDDVPVFMPGALLGIFGPFSPLSVSRITVHKTGFAARHGSRLGGIIAVEQSLGRGNRLEVQADPFALNGRIEVSSTRGPDLDAAATVRRSLWNLQPGSSLQDMLGRWSRPDLFVLAAPWGPAIADSLEMRHPVLSSSSTPLVDLTDVHVAGRLRLSGLRTLQATFYRGRHVIEGGVIPQAFLSTERAQGSLTTSDEYVWTNSLAQLRYQAVTGNRTLLGLQIMASGYDHDNVYHTALMVGSPDVASTGIPEGQPHVDSNTVGLLAFKSTLDYAYGKHDLRLGLDVERLTTRFTFRGVHLTDDVILSQGFSGVMDRTFASDFAPSIRYSDDLWLATVYVDDDVQLTRRVFLQAGARGTFHPTRNTVYAEPRLGILVEGRHPWIGTWTSRTAAGIHRQFINQMDAGKLSPGAVLPSIRMWLPVDGSMRPPLAAHLSQEVVLEPAAAWTLRGEVYARYLPNEPVLRYAGGGNPPIEGPLTRQAEFLSTVQSRYAGGVVSVEWKDEIRRAQIRYAFGYSAIRGEAVTVRRAPWTEPHRIELGVDTRASGWLTLSGRWCSVWGRSWGYRRSYYDYYAGRSFPTDSGPIDFDDPSADVLPPLHRMDLGAAFVRTVGTVQVQLRLEVLNALGRANVASWRLVADGENWHRSADTYHGRSWLWAIRMAF